MVHPAKLEAVAGSRAIPDPTSHRCTPLDLRCGRRCRFCFISPMPRLAILSLVVLSSFGLSACSKKQETAPPSDAVPQTTADVSSEVPPPREFDFSGRSSNTGPSDSSPAVQSDSASPADPGRIEVQMPVLVEYYPPFYPFSDRMKGAEGQIGRAHV